jgi:hypothetical protein
MACGTGKNQELSRRRRFWAESSLRIGLNAITYHNTLRHLALARLLVIPKSIGVYDFLKT